MAKQSSKNNEKPLFEVKEELEDRLVYQRVINKKGRSKKDLQEQVDNLPTATVYFFSEEDFNRLKAIENKLAAEIVIAKEKTGFKNFVLSFLEVDKLVD